MNRYRWTTLAVLCVAIAAPAIAQAQPNRQLPGTRPHLPGSPPVTFPEANSRTRAAQSGVGLESTDFYGKKGYPRVLGDVVETSGNSGATGNTGISGGGNTGAQSAGSGGFQGNSGNQIGQNSGGTVLGGLFGFANNPGANGFGGNQQNSSGISGGAFTGMVPKGFGFGGTPDYTRSWTTPLSGLTGK